MAFRAPRPFLDAVLLGAVAIGCATPKAYPGPPLELSQLAVVRGAVYLAEFLPVASSVCIHEIDGEDRREDWSSSCDGDVHLLPGSYDLTVQYQRRIEGSPAAASMAAGPQVTRRSLQVAVEAGYTYTVNFDIDNTSYFVVRKEHIGPGAK